MANDLRYALRMLGRQRGYGTLAVLTMALAIGVITTLFSVLHGVLLRPLPWPQAERLVRLTETHVGATRQMPLTMTNMGYLPWLEQPTTIDGTGAWLRSTVTLTGAGETARVPVASITPSTFALLQASPLVGSLFTRDDDEKVVLSFGFWQERFGGNPQALGQSIQLNGRTLTIAGVMPREFVFPDRDTRMWRPLAIPPVTGTDGKSVNISTFNAMARLKPGVTPAQAAAEATARARSGPDGGLAAMALFGTKGPAEISAVPALDALTGDVKPGLIALFGAVSSLLLATVSNIASLQLARATTRYREIAIRAAIGAGTLRLVRQLVIENMVLAAAGGVVGLMVSIALHRLLPSVVPADFPRLDDIAMRSTVMVFALILTAIVGIALGVLPALQLRRLRLTQALADNASGSIGGTRGRARQIIMVGQVAIACTLLVGAVLLTRSFAAMVSHDRGYDPHNVLTARLALPDFAFTPQARVTVMEALLERARTLPNAPALALTTGLPLTGSENVSGFTMPSIQPPAGTTIQVQAVRSVVSPNFFSALGLRIVQGRSFAAQDDSSAASKVVIVNRTFAKRYLSANPVGDKIRNFMRADQNDYEVVGIVDDVLRRGVTESAQPEIYSLIHQSVAPGPAQDIVIRTAADPLSLVQPLRSLIKEIAPAAALESVRTMDDRIAGSLARPRMYAVVLAAFAASALVIAVVGLFGVLSYTVAQRTREIALRTALGAKPAHVFQLVVKQGLEVTAAGLALGLLVSFVSARYLGTLLFGISSHDVASFVTVPLAISAVAVAACVVPALRAMRIDPQSTLRT